MGRTCPSTQARTGIDIKLAKECTKDSSSGRQARVSVAPVSMLYRSVCEWALRHEGQAGYKRFEHIESPNATQVKVGLVFVFGKQVFF